MPTSPPPLLRYKDSSFSWFPVISVGSFRFQDVSVWFSRRQGSRMSNASVAKEKGCQFLPLPMLERGYIDFSSGKAYKRQHLPSQRFLDDSFSCCQGHRDVSFSCSKDVSISPGQSYMDSSRCQAYKDAPFLPQPGMSDFPGSIDKKAKQLSLPSALRENKTLEITPNNLQPVFQSLLLSELWSL